MLVVDQLRPDQLERYGDLFTGGLRRLLDEGYRFEGTVHDHALTWTSAGHATLATGLVPRRHGVVANRWAEPVGSGWVWTGSVEDTTEREVGSPGIPGASPRKLQSSSLADWIRARHPGARVVSISGKSTAAVLLGGRGQGYVYWFDRRAGRFVTSTYYRERDPEWVDRFNARRLPDFFADSVWESTVPAEARSLSRRDTAAYEYDRIHTFFPHRYSDVADPEASSDYYAWFDHGPLLDASAVALAEEAVAALELGRGPEIDYLALSLSSTDRVGHDFGPWSREQMDNLLRLDRLLGAFLEVLDEKVGEGRYVLGLSADHGVLALPEYRTETGLSGRRLTDEDLTPASKGPVQAGRDPGRAHEDLSRAHENPDSARGPALTLEELESLPDIADVMREEELLAGPGGAAADSFVALYRNSYVSARRTGRWVEQGWVVRLKEGRLPPIRWGTNHGSPYMYDRRVPMMFAGAGVQPGVKPGVQPGVKPGANHRVSPGPASQAVRQSPRTVDFAPTLAALSGIPFPDGLDGRPLLGLDGRPLLGLNGRPLLDPDELLPRP